MRLSPARTPLLLAAACSAIAVIVVAAALLAAPRANSAQILGPEELGFLTLLNNYRASQGKPPMVLNDQLNDAARWLSDDFADKNYLSHTDSLNRDMTTRLKAIAVPFIFTGWAENIAAGYPTADGAFNGWKNSPGHNTNMLGDFNVIGIAMTCKAGTTYGCYWATDFGKTPGPPPPTTTPQGATPTPTPTPSPTPSPTPVGTPVTPSPSATPNPNNLAVPRDDENVLLNDMQPGDHTLELGSAGSSGLEPGDVIVINPGGPNEEIHTIAGTNPLRTDDGMQFSHAAGEIVVKIQSGDVNCDQKVDMADALAMIEYLASLNAGLLCIDIGDTNCDQDLTASDPLNVVRRGAALPRANAPGNCPPVGGGSPAATKLRSSADAGDESLDVDSTDGFEIGDTIRLNPGTLTEEEFVIQDFGSFIVSELRFDHAADEPIEKVLTVPFMPEGEGTSTPSPTPLCETPPATITPQPTPCGATPTDTATPEPGTQTPTPVFCDEATPTPAEEETQTPTPTPCVPAPTPSPTLPFCDEGGGGRYVIQGPSFTPTPPPTEPATPTPITPSPTPCQVPS